MYGPAAGDVAGHVLLTLPFLTPPLAVHDRGLSTIEAAGCAQSCSALGSALAEVERRTWSGPASSIVLISGGVEQAVVQEVAAAAVHRQRRSKEYLTAFGVDRLAARELQPRAGA